MSGARGQGSGSRQKKRRKPEPRISNRSPIVTLLTDFGLRDPYVAAMKGVLLTEAPMARVVDAGHDIPARDIQAASWILAQYGAWYPEGTIHVAVVDPGVGTVRDLVLARVDGRYYLAPDNGLLTWVLERGHTRAVRKLNGSAHRPGPVAATFHGRDILAWAAGRLARDIRQFTRLSRPASTWVREDWPRVTRRSRGLKGRIVHVDSFGNLISNIAWAPPAPGARTSCLIRAGTYANIPLVRTYGDARNGALVALVGSSGTLELAVAGGHAARETGLQRGAGVDVEYL